MFVSKVQGKCKVAVCQMFWCVVGFVACVFVPFATTKDPYIKVVKLNELTKHLNETKGKTVALFSEDESAYWVLRKLAVVYGDKAEFCVVHDARRFLSQYNCRDNSVLLFVENKVWLAASMSLDESGMFFLLEDFLGNHVRVARSKEGLLSMLGTHQFSFVSTKEKLGDAVSLHYKVAPFMGPFGVVVAEQSILSDMGIDSVAMFRREDKVLVPVNNDIGDVMEKTMPSYRNLVPADLNGNATVVVICVDQPSQDMQDFMYRLSVKFPEFVVGYAVSRIWNLVRDITLLDCHSSMIVALSGYDRSYYPFSGCSVQRFQKDVWFEDVSAYLNGIKQGKIPRKYHVEEVEQTPGSLVVKLNGQTYREFLNDTKHDIALLYVRDDNASVAFLERIAREFHDNNIDKIKFGVIDVYKNSCPERFPLMPYVPQIRVFPHENHTNAMPFIHTYSRDLFLAFLNRTTSLGMPLPLSAPLDHDTVKGDVGSFISIMGDYPTAERERMIAYYRELWLSLNITIGVQMTTETFDADGYQAEL